MSDEGLPVQTEQEGGGGTTDGRQTVEPTTAP